MDEDTKKLLAEILRISSDTNQAVSSLQKLLEVTNALNEKDHVKFRKDIEENGMKFKLLLAVVILLALIIAWALITGQVHIP